MVTKGIWLALLWAALAAAGCEPDISVCELPDELNTCENDDDCLIAYCGIDCCRCERVASTRQFDETYCMATLADGYEAARSLCQEARDTVCSGEPCTNPCPHPQRAVCDGGRCVAGY
jgi:hypothetical protein